ncbi:MAG: ABC transporter permease [Candidatus Promineifilaceae bacterium]|jgi:peptide/nickel transport system permease protein
MSEPSYKTGAATNNLTRRLLAYAVTLFLAITLNFLLPHAMPGDPLALIAGSAVQQMNKEQVSELRAAYGLDEPLFVQYGRYLGRLARGDLGQSYRFSGGRSVAEILGERFVWTFGLVAVSLGLATAGGILLGAWAAWRHGSMSDLGLLTGLFALRSVPTFWLAMILIPIFAVRWQLLPVGDSYSFPRPEGWARFTDVARHAVLPVMVLALAYLPIAFAIMRSSMLSEVGADYVRALRAKGAGEHRILYRHTLRNAILPVLTVIALDFGQMLGGALLIETVFNYRGLGSMMFEAVKSRDYPLLQGGFLLFTVGVLSINLFVDLIYPRLDPRVRKVRS